MAVKRFLFLFFPPEQSGGFFMGGFILPYPVTSTPLFFASRVSIAVMDFTSVITKIFQTKLKVKWNIALW